ncbi:hypothetical protein WJX73_005774 [Symbiochloris irregularis]|uniref:Uncharacterized protein n=1 Tax=Symbiochloris irregularis TaxID=706552 RepID=A0AAW1PRJ1_9CHLO
MYSCLTAPLLGDLTARSPVLSARPCDLQTCRTTSYQAAGFSGRLPSSQAVLPPGLHAERSSKPLWVRAAGFGAPSAKDKVNKARTQQLDASELLAQLLKTEDARALAASMVNSIDEPFFLTASTYLDMAKKENNNEVTEQLESVLKICMEEKQKTLPPEIQLLNTLLSTKTADQRKEIMSAPVAMKTMTSASGKFDKLVNRMMLDIDRQPANASGKSAILQQLEHIQKESSAIRSAAQ